LLLPAPACLCAPIGAFPGRDYASRGSARAPGRTAAPLVSANFTFESEIGGCARARPTQKTLLIRLLRPAFLRNQQTFANFANFCQPKTRDASGLRFFAPLFTILFSVFRRSRSFFIVFFLFNCFYMRIWKRLFIGA